MEEIVGSRSGARVITHKSTKSEQRMNIHARMQFCQSGETLKKKNSTAIVRFFKKSGLVAL